MRARHIYANTIAKNKRRKDSKGLLSIRNKKLKHLNNILVIELEKAKIRLNSKKRNILKKLLIKNFKEALYSFLRRTSESSYNDNYYFEKVNKVEKEAILVYYNNIFVAKVTFRNIIKYSVKERKYYVDDIIVNLEINENAKKRAKDTAIAVLYTLSIIFKKNYDYEIVEEEERKEELIEKVEEYFDKIISEHTYEVY